MGGKVRGAGGEEGARKEIDDWDGWGYELYVREEEVHRVVLINRGGFPMTASDKKNDDIKKLFH